MSENTSEVTAKKKDNKLKTVVSALLCAVIIIALDYPIGYFMKSIGIDPKMSTRVCLTLLSVAAFIILGGKKWLRFDAKGFGRSWLICLPIMLYEAYQVVPAVIWRIEDGIPPGVCGRLCYILILYILVGVFEEFLFRGLVFGGLLRALGKKKHGLVTAAVIASLIFGYAHVYSSIDYTNIYSVMTALLKTVQTGLYGFILCYSCVRNKQIWGAVAVHIFSDFMLRLPNALVTLESHASYVNTDRESALIALDDYSTTILFYLIPWVIAFIKLRKVEPTEAPFGDD